MPYDPRNGPVSESCRRLNQHLFGVGAVAGSQRERHPGQALDSQPQARGHCQDGVAVRVSLIALRRRLLDGDNLQGGFKPLRDAVAESLGLDDADNVISWEYHQMKCEGHEGAIVKIEVYEQPT